MNKYTFYGTGEFKNRKYTINANTKREAIEKAKKEYYFQGVTVSTMRKVK